MPRLSPDSLPKYGKHKQSGQARVVLNGRHFLLGPYGSKASIVEYDRLLAEWVANGRQLPAPASGEMTISTLIVPGKVVKPCLNDSSERKGLSKLAGAWVCPSPATLPTSGPDSAPRWGRRCRVAGTRRTRIKGLRLAARDKGAEVDPAAEG